MFNAASNMSNNVGVLSLTYTCMHIVSTVVPKIEAKSTVRVVCNVLVV